MHVLVAAVWLVGRFACCDDVQTCVYAWCSNFVCVVGVLEVCIAGVVGVRVAGVAGVISCESSTCCDVMGELLGVLVR